MEQLVDGARAFMYCGEMKGCLSSIFRSRVYFSTRGFEQSDHLQEVKLGSPVEWCSEHCPCINGGVMAYEFLSHDDVVIRGGRVEWGAQLAVGDICVCAGPHQHPNQLQVPVLGR